MCKSCQEGKDCHDFREATVTAHHSGNCYKVIYKQLEIQHSTVTEIVYTQKSFKTVAGSFQEQAFLQIQSKVRPLNAVVTNPGSKHRSS